ncbi:MAG: PF20097 family protein [Candidatus Thermoplasmatota archaeon]|nr:PF20097 family protein [Candidatus Thermoplasmatota archaeon]
MPSKGEQSSVAKARRYTAIFEANREAIVDLHVNRNVPLADISKRYGIPYEPLRRRLCEAGLTNRGVERECPLCGRPMRPSLIGRHMEVHFRNYNDRISCPRCHSKDVKKNGTLATKNHGVIQAYMCNVCRKFFNSDSVHPKYRTPELQRFVTIMHNHGMTWREIADVVNRKLGSSLSWDTIRKWKVRLV